MGYKYNICIMEGLSQRMYDAKASNEALAERAGVSIGTVSNARLGKYVRVPLAAFIDEALKKYEYKYLTRGRRPK